VRAATDRGDIDRTKHVGNILVEEFGVGAGIMGGCRHRLNYFTYYWMLRK